MFHPCFAPRRATPTALVVLFAALVISGTARPARAAPARSALVVYGKAEARIQDIVNGVVDSVLRQAGWSFSPSLSSSETNQVRACLFKEPAWPCVEATAAGKKGIERVAAVRVDLERLPDGTSQVVLSGRLVHANSSSALEQKRYCGACSDEDLTAYAHEISKLLVEDRSFQASSTKIGVTSVPMGAEVRIDGKVVGITNNAFSASPGNHTIEVRYRGHQAESRSVTAIDGKTVVTSITLKPGDSSKPPVQTAPDVGNDLPDEPTDEGSANGGAFRKWGPKAMVGAGAALIVTGVVFIAVLDEDKEVFTDETEYNNNKTYRDWAPAGAVALIGGAALAGAGGYLWWKWRGSAETTPVVSTTSNSALVGITGTF